MKHLVSKKGFLFVNKDFINGVIVAKELFIPDDHNLDLYMELPEQEVLELQEKYNNGGGGLPPQQKIDVAAEGIKFAYSTFEEVPEVFDFSKVTDISNMFTSSDISKMPPIIWGNITSAYSAFQGCKNLSDPISIKLTVYNGSDGMFDGCSNITQIIQFIAPLITGCRRIFQNSSLKTIGLIDIPICKDLSLSFSGCKFLNFPKINAPKAENCTSTFAQNAAMEQLEYWDFSNVTVATNMFKGCSALSSIGDVIFLHTSLSLADSPNIDEDTLNQFGAFANAAGESGVAPLKSLGLPAAALTFNTTVQTYMETEGIIAKLTDENWTVNFADSM